jgi:hypothetical protein
MTDIELLRPKCYCYNCSDSNTRMTRMILCPECGNKRCPRATDHSNACTNSNESGQEGSRYSGVKWGEVVNQGFPE